MMNDVIIQQNAFVMDRPRSLTKELSCPLTRLTAFIYKIYGCCVVGCVVSGVLKAPRSFETSGITYPTTQRRFREEMALLLSYVVMFYNS
jgi:hypothetical protein